MKCNGPICEPVLQSRPYQNDNGMACERCVFGSGPHARWCPENPVQQLNRLDEILQDAEREAYYCLSPGQLDGRLNVSSRRSEAEAQDSTSVGTAVSTTVGTTSGTGLVVEAVFEKELEA